MPVSITCDSIVMNISFIIKARERYFVYLITSQLMVLTSDCFHLMHHLLVIEESIFIIIMYYILLNNILLDTFSSLTLFLIIFNVTVHLGS